MNDPVIVKSTAAVAPGDDDESSPFGTFSVVLSTPTEDRDGEEVKSDEWQQPLPDHITFDVDHGMSVASTVGSGKPEIDEQGRLVVPHGVYASTPLAQQTRALVRERHVRAVSVAFLRKSHDDEKGGKRVTRELLNGAFVAVPANIEAVVLDAKTIAAKTTAQTAHDLLVELGAQCTHVTPTEAPTEHASEPNSLADSAAKVAATAAADEAAAAAAVDAAEHVARVRRVHEAALVSILQTLEPKG